MISSIRLIKAVYMKMPGCCLIKFCYYSNSIGMIYVQLTINLNVFNEYLLFG